MTEEPKFRFYPLSQLPQQPPVGESAWSAGWQQLDRIFRFYPGQLVVMTGIAGSGKSTILLNMVCNMARQTGIRSFLYVPENEQRLLPKMQKIWGDDQTFGVFADNQCFIRPSRCEDTDDPHTLDWVLRESYDAIRWKGIDLIVVDPWNELERCKPKDWLLTEYIGESLMVAKEFLRSHKIAMVIVAHPTKAVNEGGGRLPQLSDIEGSMNWANKADNGLIVTRDHTTGTGTLISVKVREEPDAGTAGAFSFYIDSMTGRAYPRAEENFHDPYPEPAPKRGSRSGRAHF